MNQLPDMPDGPPRTAPDPFEDSALRPARILVAEDDPTNRAVTEGFLAKLGLSATFAFDGGAAVAAWRDGAFDIVLMDCMMPGVDGYQAAAEIRRIEQRDGRATRTPIIAVTAAATPEDRRRCIDAGMDDHLSKPIRRAQLAATLERWLGTAGGLGRRAPETPAEPGTAQDESAAPVLDRAAIEPLRTVRRGGESILQRAVLSYFETTPRLIAELTEALSSGRRTDAHRFAHTIKSSSANLGARRLAALARTIEAAAGSGAEVPDAALARLEAEFEVAVAALAEVIEQEPAAHVPA